jgi:hypothetical protein
MKMGLPSCLSRMRGQLACPVLRGARASNGPRLLDHLVTKLREAIRGMRITPICRADDVTMFAATDVI